MFYDNYLYVDNLNVCCVEQLRTRQSGGDYAIRLDWSGAGQLQVSDDPARPDSWSNWTGEIQEDGEGRYVEIPAGSGAQFFRLRTR